jgi:cell division septum initiation protein DivIVA
MASVAHPVPSRMAQNVAALYGHEDDTLIAWQRFCAQATEALRAQHDPERLTKALALAQGGQVALEDDGYALVTSGTKRYQVQADGTCDCPDFQHRSAPCKHVLAVLIHARAQELVAPSQAKASALAAPSAPAKPTRPAKPRHSAAWDVHEAPVSSCFKIRVGAFEWTHTMRATDDAELHTRVQAFVPTFREIVAALDVLQAEREAAKAAPATLAPQPASTPANVQALIQQAVQQALAAQATGQAPSTPPPAAPSGTGTAAATGGTPFCHVHQVAMELRSNERGSWWSHRLADGSYCKGK